MMLCPFNREKMAPHEDMAVQVAHARGCLVLRKMLHKGFSSWRFFPSPHLPAFAGAAGGKVLARASASLQDGAHQSLCPEAGLCQEE